MIKKKFYITPAISFDSIEEDDALCLVSAEADNKEGENWGGDYAKQTYFEEDFEDSFEEEDPWEQSANYSNLNW